MNALNGIAPRLTLILALSICWLFPTVATGQALTGPQERTITKDIIWAAEKLTELCGTYCEEIPVLFKKVMEDVEGTPKEEVLIGVLLAAAVAGGVVTLAARGLKKDPSIAPPDLIRSIVTGVTDAQDADVTVFGPESGRPSEQIIAQVIVHTPDREAEIQSKALKLEPHGRVLTSSPLTVRLEIKDNIDITMDCDRATIAEPIQSAFWNGRYVNLQFLIRLPDTDTELVLISKIRVFVNSLPAGTVLFRITVSANADSLAPSFVPQEGHAYRKFFLSYAREDRAEALKYASMLRHAKMKYFQDVLTLDPGERWEPRLFQEIERSDIFVLFWSRHARASEWVLKEAEYALRCSKKDVTNPRPEISPYPLEAPSSVEPPASLREINFNDPVRYAIFFEEMRARKSRKRKTKLNRRRTKN